MSTKVRSLQYTVIGGATARGLYHLMAGRDKQDIRQNAVEMEDKDGSRYPGLTRGRIGSVVIIMWFAVLYREKLGFLNVFEQPAEIRALHGLHGVIGIGGRRFSFQCHQPSAKERRNMNLMGFRSRYVDETKERKTG